MEISRFPHNYYGIGPLLGNGREKVNVWQPLRNNGFADKHISTAEMGYNSEEWCLLATVAKWTPCWQEDATLNRISAAAAAAAAGRSKNETLKVILQTRVSCASGADLSPLVVWSTVGSFRTEQEAWPVWGLCLLQLLCGYGMLCPEHFCDCVTVTDVIIINFLHAVFKLCTTRNKGGT